MQLPRYHRLRGAYYRLEGTYCARCDVRYFPPRSICRSCKTAGLPSRQISGWGELYSYSRLARPPRGFEGSGPYTVAIVRLDDGPLVVAQMTDVEGLEPSIGMPVEMVTRKIRDGSANGYIVYGYKFRPRLADPSPATTSPA